MRVIEGAFFRASVWAINTIIWEACVRCTERLSGEIVISVASPGREQLGTQYRGAHLADRLSGLVFLWILRRMWTSVPSVDGKGIGWVGII